MGADPLFVELAAHLENAGVEIRVEPFKTPPDSAGGLCVVRGNRLMLLHSGASQPEQARALMEAVETIGLESLGLTGAKLSPELLRRLNRRGKMPWPHRSQAPSVARADTRADDDDA